MKNSSSTERKSAEHPDSFVIAYPSAFLFGTAVKMRTDLSRVYRENFAILGNHLMASIFDVKALLKERRQMSVKDVSYHFRIPEGLAEMMLERLADKGVAKLMPVLPSGCGATCSHCTGPASPVYRWSAPD